MMNLSNKGLADSKVAKLSSLNRVTTLNPSAAEFVPSALKYTYGVTKSAESTKFDLPGSSRKAVLDQTGSNTSNNSDDEIHQYWRDQLPDDITPDFEVIGEEELHEPSHLTLAGFSVHDGVEQSKFSALATGQTLNMRQDLSSPTTDIGNMGYPGSVNYKQQSSVASMISASNMKGKSFIGEQHGKVLYDGDLNADLVGNLMGNLMGDNVFLQNSITDPIEYLSSQFPGFAVQSLLDVYYANGCDLTLTIEILTQLELQVDSGSDQNLSTNSLAAPNFSPMDFPALPLADTQNQLSKYTGEDVQHGFNMHKSSSGTSRGDIDFASTVRKLALQDSGHWKYDRKGSADTGVGSSSNSQQLATSYNGLSKMVYGDKWHGSGPARSSPVWLETGEAVANIYSESREEARDFARLRNACFEQARQAYLIGNKALAKELSLKGQLYNMQMKAAHEKAKETIYQRRNPSSEVLGCSRGQDHLIDLHGLHVGEAIHVLHRELRAMRNTARAAGQQLHALICVGTGHHTKGSRTPARLPVAIEQYLVEEGLRFTQPQPGLLRVVIY
ncbi:polyadenylate-binding protein-interacting protein 7-like isoform X2 [Musa acuminata AAA Group]|uniref:polyadenylate-binding protein-interacting protein 7-like isoform X2 n=1 Tax=Musa acuminata AAA Group TaxID=214697 RepID=UPI0031DBFA8C